MSARSVLMILVATTSLVAPFVWGQEDPLPNSIEAIDELAAIAAASGENEVPAEIRTELEALYVQAKEALVRAQSWDSRIAQYELDIAGAPDLLKSIENEIEDLDGGSDDNVTGLSFAELEQRLASAKAEQARLRSDWDDLQKEPGRRSERRRAVPELMAAARTKLEEIRAGLATPSTSGEAAPLTQARRLTLRLRERARETEIRAYDAELRSYDVRGALLTQRIARAARLAGREDDRVALYTQAVSQARRAQVREVEVQTRQARADLEAFPPHVRQALEALLTENSELNALRTGPEGLLARMREAQAETARLTELVEELKSTTTRVRERVAATGGGSVSGELLRRQAGNLPDLAKHERSIREREIIIGSAQLSQIDMRERWLELVNLDVGTRRVVDSIGLPSTSPNSVRVEEFVREALTTRRDTLDGLVKDYDTFFGVLVENSALESEIIDLGRTYGKFVAERVLFIRSGTLPYIHTLSDAREVIRWWGDRPSLLRTMESAVNSLRARPIRTFFALAFVAWLAFMRGRFRRAVAAYGAEASKNSCLSIVPTLKALAFSVASSASIPVLFFGLGIAFGGVQATTEHGRALVAGLWSVAAFAAVMSLTRSLLTPDGLAVKHFRWEETAARDISRLLAQAYAVGVLTVFVTFSSEATGVEAWKESLGRLAFLALMGTLVWTALRAFGGEQSAAHRALAPLRGDRLGRRLPLIRLVAVGAPAFVGAMSLIGFHYTAVRLGNRVFVSFSLLGAIFVAASVVQRWFWLERRRLAREQAKRLREKLKSSEESPTDAPAPLEDETVNLQEVDIQSQRLARSAAVLLGLAGLWFVWADFLPVLNALEQVELSSNVVSVSEVVTDAEGNEIVEHTERTVPVTLRHLILAALVGVASVVAVRNVPGLLEILVLQRMALAAGERYAVISIVRYLLAGVGLALAFNALGIGWGRLQWLVAALGLGLGFGLQEIFANFISGLILLLERPIRLGDTVTVGGVHGTVTRIRIRATTITDFDRKELIVPNKEFITGQLVNWTLSDAILRVIVPVGVSYDSDVDRVVDTLVSVALNTPEVLPEPKPVALFLGFGDSTLNFELRVHCSGIDDFIPLKHKLHLAICKACRANDIEIAYPQRDLHVRSVSDAIPFVRADRVEDRPPPQEGA